MHPTVVFTWIYRNYEYYYSKSKLVYVYCDDQIILGWNITTNLTQTKKKRLKMADS